MVFDVEARYGSDRALAFTLASAHSCHSVYYADAVILQKLFRFRVFAQEGVVSRDFRWKAAELTPNFQKRPEDFVVRRGGYDDADRISAETIDR